MRADAWLLAASVVTVFSAVVAARHGWLHAQWRWLRLFAALALLALATWLVAMAWGSGRAVMWVAIWISVAAAALLLRHASIRPRKAAIARLAPDGSIRSTQNKAARWLSASLAAGVAALSLTLPLLVAPSLAPSTKLALGLLLLPALWALASAWLLGTARIWRTLAILLGTSLVFGCGSAAFWIMVA